ncbi:MmcQ/YjbR family DNA-binding protein [Cellulosimicrobium sp. CUA-896]|uniref:MmcQ/YjbR family DNA-binding protein n=1 Tax=Cellulosimicrobium sp. CUA-896 TaxID=1517881 RepID=UPI000969EA95|nr:MmcQ/YjbR family DNA-binding protein [Cellulosimicrobium sp. CUA-896]OLT45972.1 hypothetical protein BJF88_05280 [Cellulosimicrobium sp. CUA-896]
MATWEDVDRVAAVLPDTTPDTAPDGSRSWRVHGKAFVWHARCARRTVRSSGTPPPGRRRPRRSTSPDEGEKEALLGDEPGTFFTTSHFHGYAIVLARLDHIPVPELEELVQDAWLARAPKRLAKEYLEQSE